MGNGNKKDESVTRVTRHYTLQGDSDSYYYYM